MRLVTVALFTSALVFGQSGAPVNQTDGPPPVATQKLLFYSGANLERICTAFSIQPASEETSISISAASNANPVSFTSTAHGMSTDTRPQVIVSGGTGSWAAVNGTFTATPTGANTWTIPVDSTAFGAVTGTLVFTTRAPRTGRNVWAVQFFVYDVSNNQVSATWKGGSTSMSTTCTAPTTYH